MTDWKAIDGVDVTNVEDGFDRYQENTNETAIYPSGVCDACGFDKGKIYTLLGLTGEVGELANKYKKVLRDGTELDVEDVAGEVGDVQWYVARFAHEWRISLGYIATKNLDKLFSRLARGKLGGSGDNR